MPSADRRTAGERCRLVESFTPAVNQKPISLQPHTASSTRRGAGRDRRRVVPFVVEVIDDEAALQAPIDAAKDAGGEEDLIALIGRQKVAVEVVLRPVHTPLAGQKPPSGVPQLKPS